MITVTFFTTRNNALVRLPESSENIFQLGDLVHDLFRLFPELIRISELRVGPVRLLHLLEAGQLLPALGQLVLCAAYLESKKY